MDKAFQGQVAVVTGASSGIGRDTAIELGRRGATVVLSSRRAEALERAASDVRAAGGAAVVIPADLAVAGQAEALIAEVLRRVGRIDILVCAAGVYRRMRPWESTVRDYEEAMALNFFGTVRAVLAVLPSMMGRKQGHIVCVSSVDGKKGLTMDIAYVPSKFAITGFMDVLRQELRGTGVYATTILPGRVDTPMIESLDVSVMSPKVPSASVARATVKALGRRGGEVIVPWAGPKLLILLAALSAPLADWAVRVFKLEGTDRT